MHTFTFFESFWVINNKYRILAFSNLHDALIKKAFFGV